jgi:pimeloyl-ACP methyl ester carboxylesterase
MTTEVLSPLVSEKRQVGHAEITMLRGGEGAPLLFFHGAGTAVGFDFAATWTGDHEVLLPYHPGFGPSPVDPEVHEVRELVPHYLQLLDDLSITQVDVVGHSLGGWIAAQLAVHAPERIRRLVLACPAGLRVPEHPTADLFAMRPEVMLASLTTRPEVLGRPEDMTIDSIVAQYRENTSLARLIWERNYDRSLQRWLCRITMPTLLLWGSQDQIIPVQQARAWESGMPNARTVIVEDGGHLLFNETERAAELVADFLREG